MDVKELRLGNLIEYDGKVCEVKEIEEAGLVVLFEDGDCIWVDVWQFSPIAITEKWLLKFRFEKGEFLRNCWDNDELSISFENGIVIFGLINSVVEIRYVHQLQNLYYCLTQKELTYE